MTNIGRLLILMSAIGLSWLPQAIADTETSPCKALLIPQSISRIRATYDRDHNPTVPTIREMFSVNGDHGGKLTYLSKIDPNEPWFSGYYTTRPGGDIQGDPRTFTLAFGNRVAFFCGFRELNTLHSENPDNYILTIPTTAEFNGALNKIDSALIAAGQEPIPVRFLETEGVSDDTVKLYVEKKMLVSAVEGNARFHDVNYHYGVIGTPPAALEHHRLQSERVLHFIEWLTRQIPSRPEAAWIVNIGVLKTLVTYREKDLDGGSANSIPLTTIQLRNSPDFKTVLYTDFYNRLLREGRSADLALKSLVVQALEEILKLEHPGYFEYEEKLLNLVNEFITAHPDLKYTKLFSLTGKINHDTYKINRIDQLKIFNEEAAELWRQVLKRRGQIAAAVTRLQSK